MKQFETRFKQVDVFPMVKHYMDELDLYNLFKKYVPAAPDSLADHAESLCILTANIICDNKPLYKVKEWLANYSDGIVDEPIQANLFNDDRLARALSALFEADRHSLMTEVSSNSISVHKLLTDEIHNDSTTVTFIGNYKNPDPDAVKLKHSHNKDFRPDCKQLVFGLNITSDGHVPLSYKLFDGNTTDDVTHIPNWSGLRTLLEKEDFIYVADCKLCSHKNLTHIAENGGLFITIVPKDRKEVKQFLKRLKTDDLQFKDAYQVESSRKKGKVNIFKTYEADRTKNGFRIIWVHSSSKQDDDQVRRQKKIDKAVEALKELSPKLNAYHLKTKKEIRATVDSICKGVKEFLDVKILTERKQIKVKISPGRPSLKSVYKNKWQFKHSLQWELNQHALLEASKTDGLFPLIERKIRMNMAKTDIEKLPILPQAMNSKKPTWNNIRYFFRNVHYSEIIQDGLCIQSMVKGLSALHKQINRLLDVPDSVYQNLQPRWWQFKHT